MQEIIIDQEIKELLPALDKDTREGLEKSLLEYGCMYPLVVWRGILIDGHNRHAICTEHGIPFETSEMEFATREDALIWVITNQVARRNLTPIQLSYYRGLHYNKEKKKVGNPEGVNQFSEVEGKNCTVPQKPATATSLGEKYDVSRKTILNDARVSTAINAIGEASPEAKAMILSGEAKIDKKDLQKLAADSDDEEAIGAVVDDILNGAYEKGARAQPPTEPATVDALLGRISTAKTALDKLQNAFAEESPKALTRAERTRVQTALKECAAILADLQKRA